MSSQKGAAWVVSVSMGYGHERAAFGLRELAHGGIIAANEYHGIPEREKKLWSLMRSSYEFVSRLSGLPLIGHTLFSAMDHFQRIADFYPRRDLSGHIFQLEKMYYQVRYKGLGKDLVDRLAKKRLPFVSTFFLPAYAAEENEYPGDIYIVCCDADVSRTWAPLDPKKSRIKYFAPTGRVVERLQLYGVPADRIFLTGFPLPRTMVGGPTGRTVKRDLAERLINLDPQRNFINKYQHVLQEELDVSFDRLRPTHPLTLTFSVGGAGAQTEIALTTLRSLKTRLLRKELQFNLACGIRPDVARNFTSFARSIGLERVVGRNLRILSYPDRATYFPEFAELLRSTDILWTKPSELSFYTGLGLPILIGPPLGSQEDFNKSWLLTLNGGIGQLDPQYINEWLFDWIDSGGLARFAWNGYIEAPTHGSYRIESVISGKESVVKPLPLIV